MSERPIQVGDLVVCNGGCGCRLGTIFIVTKIAYFEWQFCMDCSAQVYRSNYAFLGSDRHLPVQWLKRIDPPAHGDSLPTREEIEA